MEHEMPYGELALVCPDGQMLHHLDWHTDQPVPLLKNVQRLTAPNPGVMTGPGTNSYLVGDPQSGYIAIDPGPDDPQHLQRLWRAAGGDIRFIVCTHSHPDHSPGARPLQALCAGKPPILGLASAPTARTASQFSPDRALGDGERVALSGGGTQHTLLCVHTPGHAANHLCLVLLEDGLLFSGDHILNGSTTIVDPPDGNMTDYLESLDKLAAACAAHGIDFILPAHGYVLGAAASGHCAAQGAPPQARSAHPGGHAGAPRRPDGGLGRPGLRRRAAAHVAGGPALAAGPCAAHPGAAGQPVTDHAEPVRLAKRVAELKGCSRSEAERYIEGGWVTVNGTVIEVPAFKVAAQQTVALDANATLMTQGPVTLLLHKPSGLRGRAGRRVKGAPRAAAAAARRRRCNC
jgi:glyoxylase-like metal-dependent hydrolase (beta-lactamase superfamily II)